jgi:hypothetical protein
MSIERYSVGFAVPGTVAPGQAYAELLAGAADPVSVKTITVTTGSNNGGHVALSHSYAIGTGAATGVQTGVAHRLSATSPTGPARAYLAWASSGVSPTGYISRLHHELLPIATGQVRSLWDATVDGPLIIEPGRSVVIVNQGSGIAAAGLQINLSWEEGRL